MNDLNFNASFSPSEYLSGLSDFRLFTYDKQVIMVDLKTLEQVPGDFVSMFFKAQIKEIQIEQAILSALQNGNVIR